MKKYLCTFLVLAVLAIWFTQHPPTKVSAEYYNLTSDVSPLSATAQDSEFDLDTDYTGGSITKLGSTEQDGCTDLPTSVVGIHTFEIDNGPQWNGADLDDDGLEITIKVKNSVEIQYDEECSHCADPDEGCGKAVTDIINVEMALKSVQGGEIHWLQIPYSQGTEISHQTVLMTEFNNNCDDEIWSQSTPNTSTWFHDDTWAGGGNDDWYPHKIRVSVSTALQNPVCSGASDAPYEYYVVMASMEITLLEIETIFE